MIASIPEGFEDLRILFLEAKPADRKRLEYELKTAGYDYSARAVDSRTAYTKALREFRPDIILSAYDLPSFTGAEALKIKKTLCPDTPFILITGAIGEERAIEVLTGGATDYILKSNLSRFIPAVQRALHEAYEHRKRKEAEAVLTLRTSEIQTILDTTPAAIFIAEDSECRRIIGNLAAQEMVELPKDVNISKSAPAGERPTNWQEMHDGVPIEPENLPLQHAVHGEQVRNYEMDLVFKEGTVKSVVGNALPFRDENGKPCGGVAVLTGITDRKQLVLQLEEQLQFERVLVEISRRFINLTADLLDTGIGDAQRRVCECLKLDISALWQWSTGVPRISRLTHVYRRFEGPPIPDPMYAHEFFPWCQQQLEEGRIVAISSMEDLPPEAARDRKLYQYFGIKSALTVPLRTAEGSTIGALNVNTVLQECTWPESLIPRLQLISEIFTNALLRKQSEMELRESEARISLITDTVGAGLWSMEADTGKIWAAPTIRELLHFTQEEELHYESYLKAIHPEDRDLVDQKIKQALQSGDNFQCDYRIALPDGSIRWIVSRGLIQKSTEGTAHVMGMSLDITERKHLEEQLKESLEEVGKLRDRLQMENVYLREQIRRDDNQHAIVGETKPILKMLSEAKRVAPTDATVLLLGETVTGKELLAQAIHDMSKRKDRSLITVNCSALSPTLIENELFGHEKGAYTGSLIKMAGRFELADGSTLFLDEIGELPMDVQGKLLRVLEHGRFERLGSSQSIKVDVRIIAATNRDLPRSIKEGKFRTDLYYRLNVFPINVPPLRDRKEDIPSLVWSFVKQFEKNIGQAD